MTTRQKEAREKITSFISQMKQANTDNETINQYKNQPEVIQREINTEIEKVPSTLICLVLGKLYKQSLPEDNVDKSISDEEAGKKVFDKLSSLSGNKDCYDYLKSVAANKNSRLLYELCNMSIAERDRHLSEAYNTSRDRIIDVSKLNYNPSIKDENIVKVYKKLDFDEISEIINDNVKKTLSNEKERAIQDEEERQRVEEMLADDEEVYDDTTMESALQRYNNFSKDELYTPSLFEGIMVGLSLNDSTLPMADIYSEAVQEYTMISMMKTLKLLSWDLGTVRNKAKSYN